MTSILSNQHRYPEWKGNHDAKTDQRPTSGGAEMLEGLADTLPGLALLEEENVLLRADFPIGGLRDKVALISGGGSGHEPAHAGYIGHGMLDAAAVGDVFTSPSVDTVLAAIRAVAGSKGVLLIIKNYTGDRLNFGLAAELARAEGIAVDSVVVADDVALRDTVEPARRRGIAGTVLVHKIAGAAAASGADLAEVAAARQAAEQVATMGVGLGACTVPATGRPGFQLDSGEAELGLGIHGEAGVRRVATPSAADLCATLLDAILQDRGWLRDSGWRCWSTAWAARRRWSSPSSPARRWLICVCAASWWSARGAATS